MSYNYSHIGHAGFGKATRISERKSPPQALPGWSGPGSSLGTEPVGRREKAALGQGASPHPQPARRGQCHTQSGTCRPRGRAHYAQNINSLTQQ